MSKVFSFLQSLKRLIKPGARVIVATSGGPDSQVLLDILARTQKYLKIKKLWAVGIDHGLRKEAAHELALAQTLAMQHGISFTSIKVQLNKGNILAEARKARYQALKEFAEKHNATHIAIAHTATDQLETVLMRLVRGSGLKGLTGIPKKRQKIIRPLLNVTRQHILNYLKKRSIAYASDPSNQHHTRGFLRQEILPKLLELNPQVERQAVQLTTLLTYDEDYLQSATTTELKNRLGVLNSLALNDFKQLPKALGFRVLRTWFSLYAKKPNYRDILKVWQNLEKPSFSCSIQGLHLKKEAHQLWVLQKEECAYDLTLAKKSTICIKPVELMLKSTIQNTSELTPNDSSSVVFDADTLGEQPLRVRSWQKGDKFQPFGAKGHTKVGDLFTDHKVPKALRKVWPLLVSGDDILWVVGLRRGSFAPITEHTQRVLKFEYKKQEAACVSLTKRS